MNTWLFLDAAQGELSFGDGESCGSAPIPASAVSSIDLVNRMLHARSRGGSPVPASERVDGIDARYQQAMTQLAEALYERLPRTLRDTAFFAGRSRSVDFVSLALGFALYDPDRLSTDRMIRDVNPWQGWHPHELSKAQLSLGLVPSRCLFLMQRRFPLSHELESETDRQAFMTRIGGQMRAMMDAVRSSDLAYEDLSGDALARALGPDSPYRHIQVLGHHTLIRDMLASIGRLRVEAPMLVSADFSVCLSTRIAGELFSKSTAHRYIEVSTLPWRPTAFEGFRRCELIWQGASQARASPASSFLHSYLRARNTSLGATEQNVIEGIDVTDE